MDALLCWTVLIKIISVNYEHRVYLKYFSLLYNIPLCLFLYLPRIKLLIAIIMHIEFLSFKNYFK